MVQSVVTPSRIAHTWLQTSKPILGSSVARGARSIQDRRSKLWQSQEKQERRELPAVRIDVHPAIPRH